MLVGILQLFGLYETTSLLSCWSFLKIHSFFLCIHILSIRPFFSHLICFLYISGSICWDEIWVRNLGIWTFLFCILLQSVLFLWNIRIQISSETFPKAGFWSFFLLSFIFLFNFMTLTNYFFTQLLKFIFLIIIFFWLNFAWSFASLFKLMLNGDFFIFFSWHFLFHLHPILFIVVNHNNFNCFFKFHSLHFEVQFSLQW
jgi:hypothetical protein